MERTNGEFLLSCAAKFEPLDRRGFPIWCNRQLKKKRECEVVVRVATNAITDQTSYFDRDRAQPLIVFKAPNRRSVDHYSTIFTY